jgi:nitrile hydratase accessory protein
MSTEVDQRVADLQGLPRKNGELVFEAPWQSRVFGMAVAMSEQGRCEWDDFRGRLIVEIGTKPERDYYANWLSALELLLLEEGAISAEELKRRQHEYLSMERDDRY